MTGYIYKITNNINNKVYIGQTINIEKRWYKHQYLAKTGFKRHLYEAMRKYGIDNFSIEIIEECDADVLDDRERYWINQYKSFDRCYGYNKSFGGEGGDTWTLNNHKEATSMLLSQKLKGKRHSEESYKRAALKRVGQHISEEQRKKISDTLKHGYASGKIKVNVPPHYDRTGAHHSDESKKLISDFRRGKTYEQIYGDNASEMRDIARMRWTGENNPNYKNVSIDEIIKLIQSGYQNKEIANMLGISQQTVWNKLKNIGLTASSIRNSKGGLRL